MPNTCLSMNRRRNVGPMGSGQAGMTLIELIIVIVIVGILAAIAIPSYRQYVIRTHRTEATTALLRLATAQEKFYVQNNRYAYPSEMDDPPPAGLGIAATTERGFYTVSIQEPGEGNLAAAQQGYTVRATPAGSQAVDADCTQFEVDDEGVRSASGARAASCWK